MDDCSRSPSFADDVSLVIFPGLSLFPFNNNSLSLIRRELNNRSCERLGDEREGLKETISASLESAGRFRKKGQIKLQKSAMKFLLDRRGGKGGCRRNFIAHILARRRLQER